MIIPNSYEIYREKLPIGASLINQSTMINKVYVESKGSNNFDNILILYNLTNFARDTNIMKLKY